VTTGRTYGKLYGNEGSHESAIPKWYMFPKVPGVAISQYRPVILAALGVLHGKSYLRDISFLSNQILALSGAYTSTLISCHRLRSGFDGPWKYNPLKFDTEYFQNLLNMDRKPQDWDGTLQYQDPSIKS
jgi:hypothetical protein